LTQEEYDALLKEKKKKSHLSDKKLGDLCKNIANTMPVKWGWGGPDPKPWTCRHNDEYFDSEWYCDKCPVQEICPLSHDYSK
jgi:hypothetical protein